MIARTLVVVALTIATSASFAQQGTIQGKLSESAAGTEQPIPFANVVLAGTSIGATTDLDGNFTIHVDPGTHKVIFSYIGYSTDTVAVNVGPGVTVKLDHVMSSKGIDITEFEVEHEQDREREAVLLMDRKESTALVQNIGAKELKKKGASDVADGVQKVVGMSVVGGRYLFVRGLGDRYNSAYLNGLPLPSPDPDTKVAPLDIFPTTVVSSISVNKAFSPELYGDFSGGAIDIITKNTAKEGQFKVSLGGGMNTNTTFKDFNTYPGGGSDFWGIDDGTRDLPPGVLRENAFAGDQQLPFRRNFNPQQRTARPDMNFGLFGTNSFKITEAIKLNIVATANYRNSYRYRKGIDRIVNTDNQTLIDYQMESYQFNTQTSGLATIGLELGKHHTISATSLIANLSTDEHRENYGDHFDYADQVYARRYSFFENRVWVNQIHGEHDFGQAERLKIRWDYGFSTADSEEPDRRQLVYLYDPATNTYQFNSIDRIENHRWYRALQEQETVINAGASYRILQKEQDMDILSLLTLHAGVQTKEKDRDFGYDIFAYRLEGMNGMYPEGVDVNNPDSYLNNEGYSTGRFFLQNVTGPEADHYIRQNINAAYGTIEADVIPKKLKILAGARLENGEQQVIYRRQSDSDLQQRRVAMITSQDLLPYASIKYDVTQKNIIRASGSKTISRPGFREMAPFEYTEFFAGTKNIGNPDLQNGTNINTDLRYEHYPAPGELIALGAFHKTLIDPIEKVALATASGQLQSFRNTESAYVYGIELEAIKNIGTLLGKDSTCWNDLSIGMNATYLKSQITIGENNDPDGPSEVLTNDERPLQGASPWLLNVDLSYAKQVSKGVKLTSTFAYNVYGRRVFAAGANGLGDQYELPLNTLNYILRADLGEKWQANLAFRNILDAEYRIEQETDNGTALINSFRTGVNIGFGVSYKL